MAYLLLFLLFIAFIVLGVILKMEPRKGAAMLINSGPIILICVGGLLTFARRGVIGMPLMLIGISLWRRVRAARPASFTEGRKSTVRSVYLEMELDHDTGEMDGEVLSGSRQGMKLSSLDEYELMSLYYEFSDDNDSIALLESYLDRYHPDWRENQQYESHTETDGTTSFDSMTKEEAYLILGLEPGASEKEILQAWRRLVKAVHPDGGGSTFLTAKINAAKDILLS